ncbi:MAG: hypothetical protein JXA11_08710 [Phycisphaerae bacterium]|nr:hypothetical protein [Phycisphaerae bacterium]
MTVVDSRPKNNRQEKRARDFKFSGSDSDTDLRYKLRTGAPGVFHVIIDRHANRSEDIFDDHIRYGRAGIYDAYLHSRDRAYTAEQVHEFLASAGMNMATYIPQRRFYYRPESLIHDPDLLAEIRRQPLPRQETIMELMWGGIVKHEFWAVPAGRDTRARLDDLENVPYYPPAKGSEMIGRQLTTALEQAGDQPITFTAAKLKVPLHPGRLSNLVFKYIDGRRTLGEILDLVRQGVSDHPTNKEILAEFQPNYDALGGLLDQLLLAHKSVVAFYRD